MLTRAQRSQLRALLETYGTAMRDLGHARGKRDAGKDYYDVMGAARQADDAEYKLYKYLGLLDMGGMEDNSK